MTGLEINRLEMVEIQSRGKVSLLDLVTKAKKCEDF